MKNRSSKPKSTKLKFIELERRDVPVTYIVNTLADNNISDNFMSLREAISVLNDAGTGASINRIFSPGEVNQIDQTEPYGVNDTIRFNIPNTTNSQIQTIILNNSLPQFKAKIRIEGPGADKLAIDGGGQIRVLDVQSGEKLYVSGLKIQNGKVTSAQNEFEGGAGVRNAGTLTLERCIISKNDVVNSDPFLTGLFFGGGILNNGFLSIVDSTIEKNSASDGGGGLASNLNAKTTILRSTISGNTSTSGIGGVYAINPVFNVAGDMTISDSTITQNNGGFLVSGASETRVNLRNNIISGNFGGIDVQITSDAVSATVTGSNNLIGTLLGTNLLTNTVVNTNPRLAPLGFYGGTTKTHALLPGSPALNAGDISSDASDQRGRPIAFGRRDIGAFESQGFNVVQTGTPQKTTVNTSFASLSSSLTAVDPNVPVTGGVVTYTAPSIGAGLAGFGSQSFTLDSTGKTVVATPTANALSGAYFVELNLGNGISPINYSLVNVAANTAPILSGVPATAIAVRGNTLSFKANASDPDLVNGLPNKLTFSLVGSPAGARIDPDTGDFSWTPTEADRIGKYAFKVRVADDGAPSKFSIQTISVTIKYAALLNGNLVIGGTAANDLLTIAPTVDQSQIIAKLGTKTLGIFPANSISDSIIVHGLDGADKIILNPKIIKNAILFGDNGNDNLVGGGGNDVLVGGDGNDTLTDPAGKNILLGGDGIDNITGGGGEDILVGGPTDFDFDLSGLQSIRAEWISTDSYANRVAHLTGASGGRNNGVFLTVDTVQDDGDSDKLSGKLGSDWYVRSVLDTVIGYVPTEISTFI